MKLINLTISGVRGFNGEQALDFDGDLIMEALFNEYKTKLGL
jgi:hypothetical protein